MKICYFGIYDREFSRNKIYMDGLRQNGVEIIECNDRSGSLKKFWRIYKKHKRMRNDYDVMIVGYPSQVVVPLAKLISRKKIILDALCSLYEGEVISRRSGKIKALKTWFIDFFAYVFADLVLVESNAQIDFFTKTFFVRRDKLFRVFTGASDALFFPDSNISKPEMFTAVFRGQFLPEAGIDTILEAAKMLEKENIRFIFLGKDFGDTKLIDMVNARDLKNVDVETRFLPFEEIRARMLSSHISLGQFADHPRLQRTIPHKAFETLALGLPYITGRTFAVSELLTDGENCLMVNLADANDLVEKIRKLKNNPDISGKISASGLALYKEKLTPKILAGQVLKEIIKLNS